MGISEAIVLAGGLGTRLQPALTGQPKCLAPILNRPYLYYLPSWLEKRGIQRTICAVGYLADQVTSFLYENNNIFNMDIVLSREDAPLGTGGAIKKATRLITEKCFLVANGDTFLDYDLSKFSDFHHQLHSDISICTTFVDNANRYGAIKVDNYRKIIGFFEKSQNLQSGQINAGHYLLNNDFLNWCLPDTFSFERDVLSSLLNQKRFHAFEETNFFLDIGTPEGLAIAQHNALVELVSTPAPTARGCARKCYCFQIPNKERRKEGC